MVQTPAFFSKQQSALSNASLPPGNYHNLAVLPAKNIYFVDLNPNLGESSAELVYEEIAIRKQILNILSTPVGSEEFEPEYGSMMPYRLQEPVTIMTAWMMENDTIEAVSRWMRSRLTLSRGDCFVMPIDVGQGDVEGYYIRMAPVIVKTNAVINWQFSVYK